MNKRIKYMFLAVAALAITAVGCQKGILDVANENEPDFKKVYAVAEDVVGVSNGLFNTIFEAEHTYDGMEMMMAVAADNVTCSHGNAGMWHLSSEPRDLAWDNSPSYSNGGQTKTTYDLLYSSISTANSIMKAVSEGIDLGADQDRTVAIARFAQGLGYGQLALLFDKAHVVDESITDMEPVMASAVEYNEVAAAALGYLDQAIAACNSSFTVPSSVLGTATDISNAEFAKIINTVAARIMVNLPRNKADLASVNWPKVKTYADAGITSDWTIVMDGTVKWYFEGGDYLTYPGWGRTDMYVVHLMDPNQPQHWPDDASFPVPEESTTALDQRLFSDFQYDDFNNFRPDRGYFNFSNYRHSRYDDIYVAAIGPKPEIMKAENDMMRAEARAYSGDLPGAAAIINAGTRVTRGAMDPVAEDLDEIIKAIHHERHVEMYTTSMGLQFFEMRKLDLLQKGTPLHFPTPAGTLEAFGETPPFYTFGKVANADGKGTSNGGWR